MAPQSLGPRDDDPWGAPSQPPVGMPPVGASPPPGASYPAGSSPPPAGYAPQADVPQPSSIRTAVTLMYVGAAFSLLGIVLGLSQVDELEEMLAEDNPSFTADQIDAAVSAGTVGMVIGGLIGAALWVWMAVMNGRGASWARIVGTVFAGINLVSTLFSLALGRTPPLNVALSFLGLAMAAVIVILMFQPASSQYYEAMSRPRYPAYGYPPPGQQAPGQQFPGPPPGPRPY